MDKFLIDRKECGPMVLDALIAIKNFQDKTLTFGGLVEKVYVDRVL